MLDITRSNQRYHFETDWLSAYWHFSFDHYRDPNNMSFGPLRVFNNDTIQPGKGFPMHGHRDMEIVTYVIKGALEHRDNTGGHGIINAGEVQRMSAGSGIMHSEFNASQTDTCELVQMWVMPAQKGVTPSYEQKQFRQAERTGKLLPVASSNAEPGAVSIGQDVTFFVSRLEPGQEVSHEFENGRSAYLFLIDGSATLNGEAVSEGDTAKVTNEKELAIASADGAELLMIDLP